MSYNLDGGRVCVLGAVEWGICPHVSMGTITSMLLLFTRSSRIRRAYVGSHAIVFKSLHFGPFALKHKKSFQTKTGSAAFSKVSVFDLENAGVV